MLQRLANLLQIFLIKIGLVTVGVWKRSAATTAVHLRKALFFLLSFLEANNNILISKNHYLD